MEISLPRLREKRARTVADMQALDRQMRQAEDAGTADAGDELQQQWAALKSLIEQIDEQISRRALLDDFERRAPGQRLGTGDPSLDRDIRSRYRVTNAIGVLAGIPGVDGGFEREVHQEQVRTSGRSTQGMLIPFSALVEQRVMTGIVAPALGAPLVPTAVDGARWIDALRNQSVVLGNGATVIGELHSFIDLPRLASPATTAFVAENSPFPISDEVWERISLRPKSAGGIVEISRTMIVASAAPGVEDIVRRDLTEGVSRTVDRAAIAGAGGVEPVGILNTANIGSVAMGANGGPLTFASIADLIGVIQDANAMGESMMFLGSPRVRRAAAKLTDLQNRPLGLDTIFEGEKFVFSNQLPSNGTKGSGTGLSTLLYGDMSSIYVGLWSGGLELQTNPFAQDAYARGNVQVRVILTCDVAVRHPQQWAAITDIAA